MKQLPDGRKNRAHPRKPVNLSGGCDPDHAGRPWCQDCKGTKMETFSCRKRAIKWLASLDETEKEKMIEIWGNAMHPDCYV